MRFIGLLFFLGMIGLVGYLYVSEPPPEVPEFRLVETKVGNVVHAISATGTIEPVEVVDVGAQIVGRVKSFGPDSKDPTKVVDFVSKVERGSIIAELDDVPFVAELEKAQSDLNLAKAERVRTLVSYEQTARDAKRAELLRGTNSESEYEASVTAEKIAQAELAIADAKIAQAETLLRQAKINLDFATIRSPIDGVILDRRVNVGQTVVAGLNAPSLFLIAKDLSHMQVWAAVNEADIGQVSIGQTVTFTVDAYRDENFKGRVSQIRLNASTANSVVTYGVIVDIDNTDGKLLPYMTANLMFEVSRRIDVLVVPNQAVRWKPTADQIAIDFREDFLVDDPMALTPGQKIVSVTKPTLWVEDSPGLVRPIAIRAGISDGVMMEVANEELQSGTNVVMGIIPKKKQDFVSSFISRVTKPKNDE